MPTLTDEDVKNIQDISKGVRARTKSGKRSKKGGETSFELLARSLAPSMPKWISDAREVLEYRMANRYLTAEHLEAERRQQVRLLEHL